MKILDLKDDNSPTLHLYIDSFLRELVGNKEFMEFLKKEPCFFSVINRIEYLNSYSVSKEIYRKEIFKCIRNLKKIKSRMES